LKRLAEFSEKAQKIKGKVKAALFYPIAVLVVAVGILGLLLVFVIPRFKDVFAGMGVKLPTFTLIVLSISDAVKNHYLQTLGGMAVVVVLFLLAIKTKIGRLVWDKLKLKVPPFGTVVSKVAISRFTRTLGTLVSSGVPILQALTIVKETAGNVIISNAISGVHESVKEGETITSPLEASGVFPPMVVSMVDVGEQTGALPEMLLRIADNYDEEVDNAVASMTSLLEPIMIVFLAGIVGSIVIAMFLPLIAMIQNLSGGEGGAGQ
jgi:type IV pilus assembly protein PilC